MNNAPQSFNLHDVNYDLGRVLPHLEKTFAALDGWLGYGNGEIGEEGVPYWFSFDEAEKHMTFSYEPSGLLFSGMMSETEIKVWKESVRDTIHAKSGVRLIEPEDPSW